MKTPHSRGPSAQAGFTLIELLIVIAIIAILSGIIITNLSGSRAKSRDGQRVSDISQIQLALEQYFDRCQQYPASISNPTTAITSATCPSGVNLGAFIAQIPTPPSAAGYDYDPYSPSGTVVDYILHTQLETQAAPLSDSLKSGTGYTTPSWFLTSPPFSCYTGAKNGNGYDYCIGSR